MRNITYAQALGEAMAEEMRRDPNVVLWGIDIGPYGGAFAATRGLYEEFGPERVIDMPVSEAGYTGAGVGAAATGLRPVVELQFSDWITIASDMLINQAAKMRYMFGGVISVPLVLRAPVGGYLSAAAQHSHMFESMFAFVPGLKVVLPATPHDAKGLLKSAIRDNNPVVFFEHKQLYEVEGSDVTLVTYSYMVTMSLAAAEQLAQEGIDVEVLDLRTVDPIDAEAVVASIRKTHRLVVVQETWPKCSISSEVAAIAAERALDYLDEPVIRVTAREVPNPFAPVLEEYVLPSEQKIIAAVKEVAG
ncbi:MAG: alpha-ketoacid dehydrogenase subunit beta [Anaerolineae bacterium]|jgi:pyruvate dehydrogenase E1 component beta subunit